MAFWFGDSFDLYTAITDCGTYWDAAFGANTTVGLSTSGRFAGSRGITGGGQSSATVAYITKTSGANDAVHHLSLAIQQTVAISGSLNYFWFTLYDGATAQCSIVFRSDGAILLTSGAANGTTLATYTGAVAAQNTWYQFEIEVVINNATGSIAVRKLGNTSNDFFLGSLNTRASANNYANKLGVSSTTGTAGAQIADDLLWRSDASSLPWLGDIRCYTRMPVTDASVQFTRSGSVIPMTPWTQNSTAVVTAAQGVYLAFTPLLSGTIGSVTMTVTTASTANFKAAIYASSAGNPTTSLGTATVVSAPGIGTMTFTFPTPPSVTAGNLYFFAYNGDATSGQVAVNNVNTATLFKNSDTYASFPSANPVVAAGQNPRVFTVNITPTTIQNAQFAGELQQDGAATYNYSSTVGQSDLYNLGSLSATPGSIVGVVTRAYLQKSDAGTRIAAVQLQSGASNNQTPLTLNTTWAWAYRTDLVDPATGAAWTATAVNNTTIGCVVTA